MTYESDYEVELVVECNQPIVGLGGETSIVVGEREYPLICDFIGDIYASVAVHDNRMYWTCPRCGHQHDNELQDEFPGEDMPFE